MRIQISGSVQRIHLSKIPFHLLDLFVDAVDLVLKSQLVFYLGPVATNATDSSVFALNLKLIIECFLVLTRSLSICSYERVCYSLLISSLLAP